MALSALVSIQDGVSAAQSLTTSANTATVTPGNLVTVSLTTPGTAVQWIVRIAGTDTPLFPQGGSIYGPGPVQSFTFVAPLGNSSVQFLSETTDMNNPAAFAFTVKTSQGIQGAGTFTHQARMFTAAALALYTGTTTGTLTAAANGALTVDGVAAVAGDRILVTLGAAGADNGLWIVKQIGVTSVSPWILTRPPEWATGSKISVGTIVEVGLEGTVAGTAGCTSWKVMTAGQSTVDTTTVALYPRTNTFATGAASGGVTGAISTLYVYAATTPIWAFTKVSGGTQVSQKVTTQTPGAPGTSSVILTVGGSDTSTYWVTALNW